MRKEGRESLAIAPNSMYFKSWFTNLKFDISSTLTSVESPPLLFLFAINNRLSRCTCCLTLRHFFNILANTQTGQDTRPHFAQCCIRIWYIKQWTETRGSYASMFTRGNVHVCYLKLKPKMQYGVLLMQLYESLVNESIVYLVLFRQRNVVNIISGGSERSTRDTASSLSSRIVCLSMPDCPKSRPN